MPRWNRYGRKAGILRNRKMAKYADALIAVWDGLSRGTANMIAEMEALGKPVFRFGGDSDHRNGLTWQQLGQHG